MTNSLKTAFSAIDTCILCVGVLAQSLVPFAFVGFLIYAVLWGDVEPNPPLVSVLTPVAAVFAFSMLYSLARITFAGWPDPIAGSGIAPAASLEIQPASVPAPTPSADPHADWQDVEIAIEQEKSR